MFRWTTCLCIWGAAAFVGLPVLAQQSRGRQAAPAKLPARGKPALAEAAVPPAPGPAGVPLLTRYWLLTDSAERVASGEVFGQYLRHFVQYPAPALQAGIGATTIHALLSVLPNGRVESVVVTRRDLAGATDTTAVSAAVARELATARAVRELDAELLRVVWQLRFKPAPVEADSVGGRADTVTISHRFAPQ